ncbi:putative undecaprenyl pyrophosphate protein [Diplogelasinospora grovesii]|uniref:tRNA (guanine(37)-N1)-methyltransferase n=1 Tax=Diplogelasinospora grovesii TaxID=303347 RepID=A0AAN6NIB7_9PEZI|nr:putative undecaprenyl pyrophosphate protein [Diplogelasinospora grovesii]
MPFSKRDTQAYRRDEKYGGKLLTAEQRMELLKPYLPPPPPPKSRSAAQAQREREENSTFGVRRFLRKQFHLLVFTIIHAFFSLYIRTRHAYHAVANRIYSVYHYHHRTPELIQGDVRTLRRLPRHLSVILQVEDDGRGGAGLERLVNEAADIAAWCASAGIPQLSIYEKTGILKGYLPETHRAISQKLALYFGPGFPALSLNAPHIPCIETPSSPRTQSRPDGADDGPGVKHISVKLLSAEDGRDSIVDLTKTLAEMAQRSKITPGDISIDLVDAELSESVMDEPDLLILFAPYVELAGYPPWQIRLTEIFHVQDNQGVGYQVFYRGLCSFAQAQMRMGRWDMSSIFRPPVVRSGAAALNRALFSKKYDIAAATVQDARLISKYRTSMEKSKELLRLERISSIAAHPDKDLAKQGRKCLLLNPGVNAEAPETWGPLLKEGVQKQELGVIPYELKLDYDYWSYHDIMSSILPEEFHDDIPAGFNTVGHVAHLNLRDHFLPYKKVVAEVLLDKNSIIKTVINKTDNVGTESQFRTFQYECLAGPDDLNVSITEGGCVFEFDYAKVYWNSRLETEHRRVISLFQPGEVVCDVMAGIGPFAVPAGKKGVFVWANDMNPESHACLEHAIKKNKVGQFVRPFCEDGRTFIKKAADDVLRASQKGECAVIPAKRPPRNQIPAVMPEPTHIPIPPTIAHFVMNLPASAIEFLGCYKGLYAGHENLFEGGGGRKLPMVHVHCFSVKADDDSPLLDICQRMTDQLGFQMKPGDPEVEGEVAIHDVRDVAPSKRMFCASFRLPRQVAFAPRS